MDYRIVTFRAEEARQTVVTPLQAPSREQQEQLEIQLVEVECEHMLALLS